MNPMTKLFNKIQIKSKSLGKNQMKSDCFENSQDSETIWKHARKVQKKKKEELTFIKLQQERTSQSGSIAIMEEHEYVIQQEVNNEDNRIVNKILESIQLLHYDQRDVLALKASFLHIVKEYVQFDGIFPQKRKEIGQFILSDGIFHEMWGKILRLNNKKSWFPLYYEKYNDKLKNNISNFQSTFNMYDSNSSSFEKDQNLQQIFKETESNRNFQPRKRQYERNPQNFPGNSQMLQKRELQQDQDRMYNQHFYSNKQRLRLIGHISINKKRIQMQMVCNFLSLKQVYKWIDLEIVKILQFYSANKKELLIVQAHVEEYSLILNKRVIDYIPKILIGVYGYVNFGQLLRVKQQYGTINGLILQDQNMNLSIWLKAQGFLEQNHQ